jgi:REP element-mobilizing transposase RayT
MSHYNPQIHHRHSLRRKGYDYSQAGMYFVTICVQDRAPLFGRIANGGMLLNDAGRMVEKWYFELENKFPDIKCHAMIVMPDHFHCIIENTGTLGEHPRDLRDDLPVAPDIPGTSGEHPRDLRDDLPVVPDIPGTLGEHVGSPLYTVIQWFKTMSTNEYIRGVKNLNWRRFNGKLWQRNYWERVVPNERAYRTITNYIINNPENWRK